MTNFSLSFLKNKKALFFVLLISVFAGIFLPEISIAQQSTNLPGFSFFRTFVMIIIVAMIWIPVALFTFIFRMFANIAFGLLNYVLSELIRDEQGLWTITNTSNAASAANVFLAGWNIVKDWANVIIVVALIGIAVATIIRFREYEAKRLLPYLIGVALLINFSVVFVGFVIDVSNFVIKQLIVGSENTRRLIISLNLAENNIVQPLLVRAMAMAIRAPDWTSPAYAALTYAAAGSIFVVSYLIVAVTFLLLSITFIERYIFLAMLFIMSPLAAVALIFPFSRNLASKWLHLFLTWAFAGLIAAFFLRIAIQILATGAISNNLVSNLDDTPNSVMPRIIFSLLVVLGFLIIGYKAAKKGSTVADVVIKGGKAAVAVATGAVVGLAAGGAKGGLKMLGRGLVSMGSKETWQKMGERFKSVASAPFKWDNLKALGKGVTTGVKAIGSPASWKKAYSASTAAVGTIFGKGKDAWNSAYNTVTSGQTWTNALNVVKGAASATPGVVISGVKTVASATTDLAFSGMGAALRGAGIVLSGKSRMKETVSDWANRAQEWTGMVDQGTSDAHQLAVNRKRMEEPIKRYKAVQENSGTLALFNMRKSAITNEEMAAIDTILAQNNSLHLVGDQAKQQEAMNNAMRFGVSGDEFTKNNADLVDVKKKKEFLLRYEKDVNEKRKSVAEAELLAEIDTMSSNFARMKIDNIENMSHEDVVREAKEKTARGAKFLQEAIKRKITDMISDDFGVVSDLVVSSNNKYRSGAIKDMQKNHWKYADFNSPEIENIMRENPLFNLDQAQEKARKNAIQKQDGRSIREDLSTNAIDMEFLENTRSKFIRNSDKGGGGLSPKKVKAFRDQLLLVQGRIESARRLGNDAEEEKWSEIKEAIEMLNPY